MGQKKKKYPEQMNVRFSKKQFTQLNELAVVLRETDPEASFSDAVRQCVDFTMKIAPTLRNATLWDLLMSSDPDLLEKIETPLPAKKEVPDARPVHAR